MSAGRPKKFDEPMTRITVSIPTRLWRELCSAGNVGDRIRSLIHKWAKQQERRA